MRHSSSREDGPAPFPWSGGAAEWRGYLRRVEDDPQLERMLPVLFQRLPQMIDEVRDLLSRDWPDYAQFLAEEQSEVTIAAEAFARWLIDAAEHGIERPPDDSGGAQLELF